MTETPFAKRVREARDANPNGLCLFRMGDFYELFHDDATVAAKVLGLALTVRGTVPMAGFPYYQLDAYVGKLAVEGYRVAVIENS